MKLSARGMYTLTNDGGTDRTLTQESYKWLSCFHHGTIK